jgi:hypothetical protein
VSSSACGGAQAEAFAIGAGSTESEIVLEVAALAEFDVGDLVAVDVDLEFQTGYLGSGVSAAYLKTGMTLGTDYIRRVTMNVARVAEKTANSLKLESALPGGEPSGTAKVQKVIGFVDREGGSFLQEWSGLFVYEPVSGGRVSFYYPRLQTAAESSETRLEIEGEIEQMALHAKFVALPRTDELDGESVVCYRSYIPAAGAPAY